jgi:hypothetical protein
VRGRQTGSAPKSPYQLLRRTTERKSIILN